MIYRLLRWLSGIALHWFYGEIRIRGDERVPQGFPLLLAVNHQNALIDALLSAWVIPRRVTLTAKATLTQHPLNAWLFRAVGIVTFRRAVDERERVKAEAGVVLERNDVAFQQLVDVLGHNGTVLIFPEGKSHSEPGLAPLKTGLARIALQARTDGGISAIHIVPIGLAFQDKGTPGTMVVAHIGEPLSLDEWIEHREADPAGQIGMLTEAVAERLESAVALGVEELREPSPPDTVGMFARMFAAWGRWNFKLPIELARARAIRGARSPDQPAMFTIINGVMLILLFSIVQTLAIGILLGWYWGALYFATLIPGAYWAAFADHPAEARGKGNYEG
jgi:1-acyl-sn-glycerol-3-phosphate acyltransferase